MGDNDKKSEDDGVEREIVYYYSREHRLDRASSEVRAMNEEYVRPSLRKTLLGSKGNIFILLSILLICAMFSITSRLASRGGSVKLGGNTVELSVIRENDTVGLSIVKTAPKSGEFFIGAVDIAVTPAAAKEGASQVFGHRVYFNPADKESFFLSLPFDGDGFFVILSTEGEQKAVSVK